MQSGMKVVRPLPRPAVLSKQIRKRIEANLTPLIRQHAFFRQILVASWQPQHQPRFRGVVTFKNDTVNADILIVNSDKRVDEFAPTTVADLWTWWEHTGTKAHIIRPVRADFLRFLVDGEAMFALVVKHPGTLPKRKTVMLNKRLSGQVEPLLTKSVAQGMWK